MITPFSPKSHFSFLLLTLLLLLIFGGPSANAYQFEEIQRAVRVVRQVADQGELQKENANDETANEVSDQDDAAIIDTAAPAQPIDQPNPSEVKFKMWDGSVVTGNVSIDKIHVATEFGTLEIPIDRIINFYPGLNSFPEKMAELTTLVEQLGDSSYDVREKAHTRIVALGLPMQKEIERFEDGGSVERKKHLAEISKALDELIEEMEDFDEYVPVRPMIRGDVVETPDFTIVGKIQENNFEVQSRFGVLNVKLSDVQQASRDIENERQEVRKSVTVSGEAFFQRTPKSTGIRVNRGDKIKIRASGTVNWTNWSQTSSPEGLPNQGKWRGFNSGELLARIGKNSDKLFSIGSKGELTAKSNGILYLGVAMQENYVNNDGYHWTGDYKAKVVVTPAGK